MPRAPLVPILDVAAALAGRRLTSITVDAARSVVILASSDTPGDRAPIGTPKHHADAPHHFQLLHVRSSRMTVVNLDPTDENLHFASPLSGERWLLVRARAASADDCNASIYSAVGKPISAFHAGDGIQDVQVSADGNIWVSFFDEGVFGGIPEGLGASGLVCLDEQGTPLFRYTSASGDHSLADCYALNVAANSDVYLYYYTDFPLVRVRSHRVNRRWDGLPVQGAKAFAVDAGAAVFAPGYNQKALLTRYDLDTTCHATAVATAQDREVKKGMWFGRQSCLYFFDGKTLFGLDVNDFPPR